MRLAVFAAIFAILLAFNSLADGLTFTRIDVHVDYDESYTYSVENRQKANSASVSPSNGSKIDVDVFPGSNVTFTVGIENQLGRDMPSIRDTTLTIRIEEIDSESDLEIESNDFKLDPGDEQLVDMVFFIPLDADSGTYNVLLDAQGDDENNSAHRTQLPLKLEVKKNSHDVRIKSVSLNPGIVDCSRKTRLTAEIMNAGRSGETELALEFKNANLGINSFDRDISLPASSDDSDSGRTYAKTLNIEVPQFFKSGDYPVYINLYWKNFILFDQEIVNLVVKDCGGKPVKAPPGKTDNGKDETSVVIAGPEENESAPVYGNAGQGDISTSIEGSSLDSVFFFAMILGGLSVLLIALAVLIGYFRQRKTEMKKTDYWGK